MKYEKCLTCDQLGHACDGPNFLSMEPAEMGAWCNAKRKLVAGLTYDKLAADTGLSKSAVHAFLNGGHADYYIETIRPIVRRVTGGKWDDNACGNLSNTEKAQYEESIRHYEAEIKWRDDMIQHFTKQNGLLENQISEKDSTIKERGRFMRRKDNWIVLLASALCLCLIIIFGALAIDYNDLTRGFIWLQ